jgi:uncharacterized protein YqjF (DUF2071 family)
VMTGHRPVGGVASAYESVPSIFTLLLETAADGSAWVSQIPFQAAC